MGKMHTSGVWSVGWGLGKQVLVLSRRGCEVTAFGQNEMDSSTLDPLFLGCAVAVCVCVSVYVCVFVCARACMLIAIHTF